MAPGAPLCLADAAPGGSGRNSAAAPSLVASRVLPMERGEVVLSVAWQPLTPSEDEEENVVAAAPPAADVNEGGEGDNDNNNNKEEEEPLSSSSPLPDPSSFNDDNASGRASVAGAVLTTRRLLVVSASLTPIAVCRSGKSNYSSSSSPSPPLTNILWAGPALLACDAAAALWQLLWDGRLVPLGSAGGVAARSSLAAAAPDRLLLARCARSGGGGSGSGISSFSPSSASSITTLGHRAMPVVAAVSSIFLHMIFFFSFS